MRKSPYSTPIHTRQFEELGYRVSQASDGLSALLQLESGEPVDLLITDYSMPGMNGVVLIKEVRQRVQPTLPVLLLTGYADANVQLDTSGLLNEATVLLRKLVSGDVLAEHAAILLTRILHAN